MCDNMRSKNDETLLRILDEQLECERAPYRSLTWFCSEPLPYLTRFNFERGKFQGLTGEDRRLAREKAKLMDEVLSLDDKDDPPQEKKLF